MCSDTKDRIVAMVSVVYFFGNGNRCFLYFTVVSDLPIHSWVFMPVVRPRSFTSFCCYSYP